MEDVPGLVDGLSPDILGLSALTIDEGRLFACARAAKEVSSDIVVVAGGPHPTLNPLRCLTERSIDYVVLGEGERTMAELVDAIDSGREPRDVPGLAWMGEDGRLCLSDSRRPLQDLDDLPAPAWDLGRYDLYSGLFNFHDLPPLTPPYAPLSTMRGCPYRCVYCHNLFGRKARMHSARRVLDDIRLLHDHFGVREIHIVDDIFNVAGKRLVDICDGLARSGLDVKLAFPNGLRGDIMTGVEIEKLARAGCYSVTFAVETASKRLQKLIRKNLDVARVLENARKASSAGLITHCYVMLGFPTETREEMELTIETVVNSEFDLPRIFTVCPFPGTKLYDMAVEQGFVPPSRDGEAFDYDRAAVNASILDDAELAALAKQAQQRIFTNPARVQRLGRILDMYDRPGDPHFAHGAWNIVRPLIETRPSRIDASAGSRLARLLESRPVPEPGRRVVLYVGSGTNTGYAVDLFGGHDMCDVFDDLVDRMDEIPGIREKRVTLAGREPTMLRWLPLAVSDLVLRGALEVEVVTYGRMLAYGSYRTALEMAQTGLVTVMLHSASPAVHDRAVRVSGCFEQSTGGLAGLAGRMPRRVRTAIAAVVGPENGGDLADMAPLARSLGCSEVRLVVPMSNLPPSGIQVIIDRMQRTLDVFDQSGLVSGFDLDLSPGFDPGRLVVKGREN